MMKKLFLAGMALLASLSADAKSLVLTLSDGTLVYYVLSNTTPPVMRRVEGGFEVNGDVYAYRDVENFYISLTDNPTDIDKDDKFTLNDVTELLKVYLQSPKSVKGYDVDGDGKLTMGDVTTLMETYNKSKK